MCERSEHKPRDTVTYIVDRNINYTNVCVSRCRLSAFYRKPGDAGAYGLPFEVIAKKVEETIDAGGSERVIQDAGFTPRQRRTLYEQL